MFRKHRNPWDDTFWMAKPSWYPPEGRNMERYSPVIAYLFVALAAFIIGLLLGYSLGVAS